MNYITWKVNLKSKSEAKNGGSWSFLGRHSQSPRHASTRGQLKNGEEWATCLARFFSTLDDVKERLSVHFIFQMIQQQGSIDLLILSIKYVQ